MEDNSVLMEDSNLEEVGAPPRKSMSQPSLAEAPAPAPPKRTLSGAQSASNVRSIPIIQTWHENEELKGQIYSLRCEVQMHQRKYAEAKEACHKSVQDVLDEYVAFKLGQDEFEEKMGRYADMEKELAAFQRQAEDFEHQKEIMERRIKELEAIPDANNTYGSLRGTLDDIMKKNDPDFTLTSGYEERKIAQLENELFAEREKVADMENHIKDLLEEIREQSARLASAENAKVQLEEGATFLIGKARQSQTEEQIKYIDELETKLENAKTENESIKKALVTYMNNCTALEREVYLIKKNSTFDSSSILIDGKTSEELKAQIDKVNGELNVLRAENRELRIRCDQLNGGDGNLSSSFADRLMAGISSTDLESEKVVLDESKLPLMDTSAAIRNKEEFDNVYDEFESLKNQLESGADESSMPPPDRDATESFLSQKRHDQIQNLSFSTKSPMTSHPMLQEVQHILDSSAMILEGQHVEKMQAKMTQIRDALSRLFERLKSSAALFEDILEKMGSSSPLAERIKQMKLAFETSISDHADVSAMFEAAERDLTNMSLNFSVLEKSIVADISKRFSIAPASEDIASSSLLNASYSPVFKFPRSGEVEKLQQEIRDLRAQLEGSVTHPPSARYEGPMDTIRRYSDIPDVPLTAYPSDITYRSPGDSEHLLQEIHELRAELEKVKSFKSPLQNSPGRLSDVQIKAAQNFEELEVSQATLKKVETEKAALARDLKNLEAAHHNMQMKLEEAIAQCGSEQDSRMKAEEAVHEMKKAMRHVQQEVETRISDACRQIQDQHLVVIEKLKEELTMSLAEETAAREQMEECRQDMERLKRRTREAEAKVEASANEKQEMVEQIVDLETRLEKLAEFESAATDCAGKMAAKKREIEVSRQKDEVETAAMEGLERIRQDVGKMSDKGLKTQIIRGNATSIRLVCEELSRRITRIGELQHASSETMKYVNENIEQLQKENDELKQQIITTTTSTTTTNNDENAPPTSQAPAAAAPTSSAKPSSNFVSPTRQLLHESTMAVDGIVQKLKKTHGMPGMAGELKETVASLILDARSIRDFLHQKLILFKGIDMTKWVNESVDRLVEKLGQLHQDNLMLEEQIKKYKKEMKQMKATIPQLGHDVEKRIKQEIGGIATDMGAVKALRQKK
uniref:Protein bicaudal D n=1 Tax=Caenorhabditis tropicalis TaxID=1561998 RepID=A0A1I7UVC5_9PELO